MESVKIREWIGDVTLLTYSDTTKPLFCFGRGSGQGSKFGYGSGRGYGSGFGFGFLYDGVDCEAEGSDRDFGGYGRGDGVGEGGSEDDGVVHSAISDASGYGYGDGSGSGYGSGDWYEGIGAINGHPVWLIDDVPTVITALCLNIAKGYIANRDLTLTPCFIAKGQGHFAHGETTKKAVEALQDKIFEDMEPEEAIEAFMAEFEPEKKYPARDFYTWHHRLTGSCEMGRKQFFRDGGYDLEHDTFTVNEFISITEHAYGGEIIRQLKEAWERKWRNE